MNDLDTVRERVALAREREAAATILPLLATGREDDFHAAIHHLHAYATRITRLRHGHVAALKEQM